MTGKIRIACFVLQGFGNDLLSVLQTKEHVELTAVYTRKSTSDSGHYESETLEYLADKSSTPVYYIPNEGEWRCGSADLAIISSFHRIFRRSHLSNFHDSINIHPSLLPSYKGATPISWMIQHGEQIVGLTAHLVDEAVDSGAVLFQRSILNPYLADSQLRRVLSFLSRDIVNDIIGHYPNYVPLAPLPRNESYFPKRSEGDSLINVAEIQSIEQLIFHIKAFTNYPMPKLAVDGKVFVVDYENCREYVDIEVQGQEFCVAGYWADPA